ncbi:MAG: hypothetical protein HYZ17_17255 [Betaproteobacteria bacterium]|nr:hypothetical protein [Betaproteobacteria bacterium]
MSESGLMAIEAAKRLVEAGGYFAIAGDERALVQLPKGNWIGGTIPYFMDRRGGRTTREEVFVTPIAALPEEPPLIRFYSLERLPQICRNAPEHGFSLIIIPGFSEAHSSFARHAPEYPEMFLRPLIGWVAGIHLDELGKRRPKVLHGQTGQLSEEMAVVMEVPLPPQQQAVIDIVNLFEPGPGPTIVFAENGFSAELCLIDGKEQNLARHFAERRLDTRLPLVADYCGARVNVSIKAVDEHAGRVEFYAPVFPGVAYRHAAPVADYVRAFNTALPRLAAPPRYSCNCVLNYLYSELEGKTTAGMTGPMTFGEIAYQLLNQTLVYLEVRDVAA